MCKYFTSIENLSYLLVGVSGFAFGFKYGLVGLIPAIGVGLFQGIALVVLALECRKESQNE